MPAKYTTELSESATNPAEVLALNRADLETLWKRLLGRPLSKQMKRSLAAELLHYELQAVHLGGLSAATEKHLAGLLNGGAAKRKPRSTAGRFKSGTRLLRRWRGHPYTVTVVDNGFEYQGRHYRSLSVIAREITGTPWSGPAFFGLTKTGSASKGAA